MFKCKYCKCETEILTFKPFKTPKRLWAGDPAWTFHIKSNCFDCHKFNGFKKQTDELMNELRDMVMMKMDITDRDLPFSDEKDAINS